MLRMILAFTIAWHSLCNLPVHAETAGSADSANSANSPTSAAPADASTSAAAAPATAADAAEVVRRNAIMTLLQSSDFKQAEKSIRDHLKSGTNEWDLNTLAIMLMLQNRLTEAVPMLETAIKLRPSPFIHFRLGGALLALNKPDEAIEYLKPFTVRASPLLETPLVALGLAYMQKKDVERASATYDFIWNRYPDKSLSWETRSWNNLLKAEPAQIVMGEDYFPYSTTMDCVKWPLSKMPLNVFIADDDSGASKENQTKYRSELMRSFEDWQKASNGRIKFRFIDIKDGADIECEWAGRQETTHAGHTKPVSNALGIRHAKIVLQTMVGDVPTTPEYMQTVCTHEIGHALGLNHSPVAADVMFTFSAGQVITERDKKTLNHLYRDDVAVQQISDAYFKYEKNEQIQLSLRCMQFIIQNDLPSVMKTAQAGISKNPTSLEAAKLWNIVGVCHTKNGELPEAELAFKQALANPELKYQNRKQCLINYAVLLKRQHRDAEAIEMRKQADLQKDEL